jgi:hypothetical protein
MILPGTRVTLRPLRGVDFKMLHRWHNAQHLRPFYMQDDITAARIDEKFTPRLNPDHTVRCRIALVDSQPFGFIQWYPSRNWPDCGAIKAGLTDGCSADYFIGNAAFLGFGLGARMLTATCAEVIAAMQGRDRLLCVAHDDRNMAAVRAARTAGFKACGTYQAAKAHHTVYVKHG